MAQYDDDQIGELDDEDPALNGAADAPVSEAQQRLMDTAMEQYLKDRDQRTLEGYARVDAANAKAEAEEAAAAAAAKAADKEAGGSGGGSGGSGSGNNAAAGEAGDSDSDSDDPDMPENTEVRRLPVPAAVRRAHLHDCESIVSTYSDLENHPKVRECTTLQRVRLESHTILLAGAGCASTQDQAQRKDRHPSAGAR